MKKPKILVLDTATGVCAAALLYSGQVIDHNEIGTRQQAALILPMLETLLRKAELNLRELDAVAFGCGPGSFTGVRLATSIAQSIGMALDLPLIPISTLRALAQTAYRLLKAESAFAAIDARANEIYYGAYQLNEQDVMTEVMEEKVSAPSEVNLAGFQPRVALGSGWDSYQEVLAKKLGLSPEQGMSKITFQAYDMAVLAEHDFKLAKTINPEQALPIYLPNTSFCKRTEISSGHSLNE